MSSKRTTSYGGNGGDRSFPKHAIREGTTIGIRGDVHIDHIRIDGDKLGGDGGIDRGSITLDEGEYISKVEIRSQHLVDYVKFTTNKGRSIDGGGSDEGRPQKPLENVRVTAIGGRHGEYADKVDIEYLENYVPSEVVQQNASLILVPGHKSSDMLSHCISG